jgi:uncharacterized protein YndB with AHSA1/START domain
VTEADTGVVEQTLRIGARPETVWRYWTDPERMCDWWGEAAEVDPQPGGTCRVIMDGGPVMTGEYVELVPYERIVFSFGWEQSGDVPEIAPGSSRVEVTLAPDGRDTILTLRHTGIPTRLAEAHHQGWAEYLPRLAEAAGS